MDDLAAQDLAENRVAGIEVLGLGDMGGNLAGCPGTAR
jgi:hypothetical protein